MLKILTANQIRQLDAYTIEHEPIASIDLMERACKAFVSWFSQHVPPHNRIGIVCGTGNNGGDGLGIARILHAWNYRVHVWVVRGTMPESKDFVTNLSRLDKHIPVDAISTASDQGLFGTCDVLIDAVFGTGLSRPPEGIYAQVIRCINATQTLRIAVDMPSGLLADEPSSGIFVHAHHTVSFQLPKLAFMLPQSAQAVGEWTCVTIGLHKKFIGEAPTDFYLIEKQDVQSVIQPRLKFDHKGRYGHALLVAGSHGKMGAAVLASRAALRSGVGLLTVHVPRCGVTVMQTVVPEAMVSADEDESSFTTAPDLQNFTTVGIGPGLGTAAATRKGLHLLLEQFRKPMVLDADAVNLLASDDSLQRLLPPGSILTPHPREFERLAGSWKTDFERLDKQRAWAERTHSVIVVKGAHTAIATPTGQIYFNSTGNPGMARGGSGDVLTGMITALLARGLTSEWAAVAGVYLHGAAGDRAADLMGMESMTASDLVEAIPGAFRALKIN